MDITKSNLKRQHRDSLFRGVFKLPKNALPLLQHCRKDGVPFVLEDIQPFDLDSDLAHRIRRNDVSFIVNGNRLIILIEHQSTINPNMALRLLLYYMELVQLWIKKNEVNLHGSTKIQDLPTPEFYVVYNGNAPLAEMLSTFKLESASLKIDVAVNIIDIHYDKLDDKQPANPLAGYAFFYQSYDNCMRAGMTAEAAFTQAREDCIKQNYLKDIIDKEDTIMFYKDFMDYDAQLRTEGEEIGEARGEARGKTIGKTIGMEHAITIAIQNNVPLSVIEVMAKEANITKHRLDELMAQVAV